MIIERNEKEILIKLPASVNADDLQDLVNYLKYKELASDIHVDQDQVDKLAKEVNKKWWQENKDKWIK